jgi:hypothetical protein
MGKTTMIQPSNNAPAFLGILGAALLLAIGPCSESLPVYQEPQKLFHGQIEGVYVLTISDNSMKVYLSVTNIFDETFDGQGVLTGSIEIGSARDPSVRKTFSITGANVISARGYDRTTGRLLIDPGDTLRLGVSWNLVDDTGRDLRRDFFSYIQDTTCLEQMRCLAFTEDFVLKGSVKLYDRTAPVLAGPTAYSFCYVTKYVNPKDCPPIITSAPCNLRPPQLVPSCIPFPSPGN